MTNFQLPSLLLGRSIAFPTEVRRGVDGHVVVISSLAIGFIFFVVHRLKGHRLQLPPGPPGWPFIGSFLQLRDEPWLKFSAWGKLYGTSCLFCIHIVRSFLCIGDVIYVNAVGQPMVVLNSRKSAVELLDRRAGIYTDRPTMIVANDILSDGLLLPIMSYGETYVPNIS